MTEYIISVSTTNNVKGKDTSTGNLVPYNIPGDVLYVNTNYLLPY
jgi:hypothetical protein